MRKPRRICEDCLLTVHSIIEDAAPFYLGEFLKKHEEDSEDVKSLGPDELRAMAMENMKQTRKG